MTNLEAFKAAALERCLAAEVTRREIRESAGEVMETEAIRAISKHDGGALLLVGDPGTGKSLAAIRWLMTPICDPRSWTVSSSGTWAFIPSPGTSPHQFRTAKSLAHVTQHDRAEVRALVMARRLVIDDLGQEYLDKNGYLASLIDAVISERHRHELPTVLTTNMPVPVLKERYGNRVIDRIVGSGDVVACAGDSLRLVSKAMPSCPALISPDAVDARVAECRAREERLRAEDERRITERSAAATAGVVDIREHRRLPPSQPPPMTEEQVAARKAELAKQVDAFYEKHPDEARA